MFFDHLFIDLINEPESKQVTPTVISSEEDLHTLLNPILKNGWIFKSVNYTGKGFKMFEREFIPVYMNGKKLSTVFVVLEKE